MHRSLKTLAQVFALILIFSVVSCRQGGPAPESSVEEHPLLGKIWDVSREQYLSQDKLISRLKKNDVVFLGEKHDNPVHHALQAQLILELSKSGKYQAAAFEQLTPGQMNALLDYLQQHGDDMSGLGKALNWEKRGWPKWEIYQPVFQAAVDAGLLFIPLGTDFKHAWKGVVPIEDHDSPAAKLLRARPFSEEEQASLREEIKVSHCGMLSDAIADRMVQVQRKKDAEMALQIGTESRGFLVIAGNGHIRTDRGIAVYLGKLRPEVTMASVAFVEVEMRQIEPKDYQELFFAKTLPYDFIWFTKPADRKDPCKEYKEQLKRLN